MANLQRLLQMRKFNKSKTQSFDFERKILRTGNNNFRIMDDMPVIRYEHWFTAACGTPVHSVCTRDYEQEMDPEVEHTIKHCSICKIHKDAWEVWNNPTDNEEEEVYQAGIIIGKEVDKGKGFSASWGAKAFGYLNVIDRDDEWCETNNHTKVLCKTETQSGITAGDKGIFNELIDLVEEYGDWSDYDTRIKKQGKKLDTEYRAYKGKEYDLTDEERAYETYDFDQLLKPTTDATITKWLEVGVKKKSTSEDDEEKPRNKAAKTMKVEAEEEEVQPKKTTKKKTLKAVPEPEEEVEEDVEEVEEDVEEVDEIDVSELEEEEVEKPKAKTKKTKKKTPPKKKKEPEPEEDAMADCPECDTEISVTSTSCPQCGTEFDGFE